MNSMMEISAEAVCEGEKRQDCPYCGDYYVKEYVVVKRSKKARPVKYGHCGNPDCHGKAKDTANLKPIPPPMKKTHWPK